MKILDLPSIFAAEMNLEFSEARTIGEIREFFHEFLVQLFEVSSVDNRLVGHIKVYSEGQNGTSIRANLTGSIRNLMVIANGDGEERGLRVWINVITHMVKEEELVGRVTNAIRKFTANQKEIVKSFSLSLSNTHRNK
ncbi:MAG: hypothetical protein HXX80_05810 [Nitrososphaerales archaeon]|nr:hypothetical protein [Nitrososphaerales archaeon]